MLSIPNIFNRYFQASRFQLLLGISGGEGSLEIPRSTLTISHAFYLPSLPTSSAFATDVKSRGHTPCTRADTPSRTSFRAYRANSRDVMHRPSTNAWQRRPDKIAHLHNFSFNLSTLAVARSPARPGMSAGSRDTKLNTRRQAAGHSAGDRENHHFPAPSRTRGDRFVRPATIPLTFYSSPRVSPRICITQLRASRALRKRRLRR